MIQAPTKVRMELYRRVLRGYDPYWGWASACDHDTDWLVLSEQEFYRVAAIARRKRADSDGHSGEFP
jgi:hypothetical protein